MEVIGGAASVSQLVVYISSSARTLHRLYTELRNGDSAYRNEETNIGLLLNILQRLERQDLEDHNPVLPVLIAISGLACQVLNLLQPRKVFGINWTPITAQDKLNSAFESLDKKRRLLHLYVSQTHHDALVDLRETIDRSNMTSQRPVIQMNNVEVRGLQSWGNGYGPSEPLDKDIRSDGLKVGYEGQSLAGNRGQVSDATLLEHARIRGHANPVPQDSTQHRASERSAASVHPTTFTSDTSGPESDQREASTSEIVSTYKTARQLSDGGIQLPDEDVDVAAYANLQNQSAPAKIPREENRRREQTTPHATLDTSREFRRNRTGELEQVRRHEAKETNPRERRPY